MNAEKLVLLTQMNDLLLGLNAGESTLKANLVNLSNSEQLNAKVLTEISFISANIRNLQAEIVDLKKEHSKLTVLIKGIHTLK